MLVQILSAIHGITTMLFGIYCSAFFLGVKPNRKNIMTLFLLFSGQGCLYIIDFLLFGETLANMSYPLIVHFPLILFLTCHYKYPLISSTISVFSAYLCCQISKWVGLLAYSLMPEMWVYYVVRIATTVSVFTVLLLYVSEATAQLLQKPTRSLVILGLMPLVYYVFDYMTGVYTNLLYSGREVVAEFLGFVLCITYILFLSMYFKQYEEKRETDQRNQLMEMKRTQSEKEIEAIKRSEYAVSILRHDMRHFLNNISSYIGNGEIEKAQELIHEVISATEKTATRRYCKNEIINLILSSYEEKIRINAIAFKYSIQVPEHLPYSEVDLTAILSNAMENAVKAVKPLPSAQRMIDLDLLMKENKCQYNRQYRT